MRRPAPLRICLLLSAAATGPLATAQPPSARQLDPRPLPRAYPPFEGKADLAGVALRSDGKTPWANARVELFWFGADEPMPSGPPDQEPEVVTVSDGRGRFGFHGLPDGQYWLRVSERGEGGEEKQIPQRSVRVDIEQRQTPAPLRVAMANLTVRGQVLLTDGGPPVAGAEVEVYRESRYTPTGGASGRRVASRTADAEGRFHVDGLDPADYRFDAKDAGEPEDSEERGRQAIALPEGGVAEPVLIVLRPYTIRGVVRDKDGAPARDAAVVLGRSAREGLVIPLQPEDAKGVKVVRADAEGRFVLGPIGRSRSGGYWLFASGADGTSTATTLRLDSRDSPPELVELQLTHTAISGTIVDADGKPLPEMVVRRWKLTPEPGYRQPDVLAATDAEGRFRFPGCDAGTFRLTAWKERLSLAPAEVTVAAGAEATVQLKHVTTTLEGVVVRPDGKPWPKARVSVGAQQATTDQAGRFRLADLLPGKQNASIRDATGRYSRAAQVSPDLATTTTVLSSGQVSDRPETLDRKVSKGCESTGFEETCRSGERRGQETLAEHIRAKYGCSTTPTRPVRLVLPDYKPVVVLAIQRPDGKPAAGARIHTAIHVFEADGSPCSYGVRDATLKADGRLRYVMEVPRGGRLQYVVLAPGIGCAQPASLEVTGLERDKVVPIRLRPAASLSGVVREETTGKPVGGVMLTPYRKAEGDPGGRLWNYLFKPHPTGDDSIFPATSSRDGDGAFTLEPLGAGTYELKVWDTFGHEHTETIELAEGKNRKGVEFRVPVPADAAFVTGRIVGTDHEPVANTEVGLRLWQTWSNRQPTTPEFFEGSGKLRRVVTDAQGRFHLGPLARRPWIIVAGDRMHVDEYGIVASLDRGLVENVTLAVPPKRR
ncbi:MAG: hypothetical protein GW880_22375 [Armatimonadetes bacterium]|nr:hypothetical protein [Armatimonadota bacterium]